MVDSNCLKKDFIKDGTIPASEAGVVVDADGNILTANENGEFLDSAGNVIEQTAGGVPKEINPTNLENTNSTFNFYSTTKQNDLNFFNRISQEITKIGTPPVQYKCLRLDDILVDNIFGDSPNPVYDPEVEVYISYVPQEIILELLQFGLSAVGEDLNVLVNKQHFEKATNRDEPQNGDKILDSRGKTYKVQNVVRDMDNVFFGDTMHYALILKLTEEGF